jgi:hypothetical protein
MKTKLSLFIIALVAISIYSCKKEDGNTPVEASALFFSVYSDSSIGKVDLKNGNTVSNFAKGVSSGFAFSDQIGLALNPQTGEIYCALELSNGPIYKVSTNGIATVLYNGVEADEPAGITYNSTNNRVYWINRGDGKVYSISASGGTPTALYGGADVDAYGYSIKLDEKNGKLYYANFDEIKVGNLDGTGTPSILYGNISDTLESPSSIVLDVDNNKVYWTDESTDVVAYANLDGSGNIKILFNNATHGVDRSDGLAIDFVSKKIYWSETNSNRIRVGNLDGTGTPVTLVSSVESYSLLLK